MMTEVIDLLQESFAQLGTMKRPPRKDREVTSELLPAEHLARWEGQHVRVACVIKQDPKANSARLMVRIRNSHFVGLIEVGYNGNDLPIATVIGGMKKIVSVQSTEELIGLISTYVKEHEHA